MIYELTVPADRDIKTILAGTLKTFGPRQLEVYAGILDKGLAMVADDPDRGGSLDRSELGPGVRLFHLELATNKRGGAARRWHFACAVGTGTPLRYVPDTSRGRTWLTTTPKIIVSNFLTCR